MWLMTKFGFYSIVQKRPGVFHIRAREREDLRVLTRRDGPLPHEKIYQGRTDYPYRLIVGVVEVKRLMEHLAQTLDYDNFKDEIGWTAGQERKRLPYYRVWRELADGLGGYGRPRDVPVAPDPPDYWHNITAWPGPCEADGATGNEPAG